MSTEFYRESKPIAKNEHKCDLCCRNINKGEEYIRITCKCTGEDLFTLKLHLTCHDLVQRYTKTLDWNDYWNEDDVINSIHDRVCCDCEHLKDCKYMYKGDGTFNYREVCLCHKVISSYLFTKEEGNDSAGSSK